MQPGIREYLKLLEENGQLVTVEKPVNPLHISALITDSDKAVHLKHVQDSEFSVVGGIVRSARQMAIALGVPVEELGKYFVEKSRNPIKPVLVKDAPLKEVIIGEKDVDLTLLPQVIQHEKDGGPYTGSGIQFAKHEKWGPDAGMYRHMFLTRNLMTVDFNSPNDIRMYFSEANEKGKPLEMAVSIGNHPIELAVAGAALPTGTYEMDIAGALRGEPVEMIKCETIDVEVPANSEIVLECEVLPKGWTSDEGRFGEAQTLYGDVKHNPFVRVKTITHRKNAIFHSLIMPTEVQGISSVTGAARVISLLEAARFRPKAVRNTLFEVLVSLDHPKPGEGKAALLALLSLMSVKKVSVYDDDIDIFDDEQVRWAQALRVQADKDVVVVSGVQAKHLDPTVKQWTLPKGALPVTSKLGIDATIPSDVPRKMYERLQYFNPDNVRLADYL